MFGGVPFGALGGGFSVRLVRRRQAGSGSGRRAERLLSTTLGVAVSSSLLVAGVAVPAQAATVSGVTLGSVRATFYPNPSDSGEFDASQVAHPAFRQHFSAIAFNPPSAAGLHCPNPVSVGTGSRPFRDVQRLPSGNCFTTVAHGNGRRAGVGSLSSFEASFRSRLHVPSAGDVTLHVFSDDGWILGLGRAGGVQPEYVRGERVNAPRVTPVRGYHVVGADNEPSAPTLNTVTVHFAAAGVYPLELDYTECCGDGLTLVLGTSAATPIPAFRPVLVEPRNTLGSHNPSSIQPKVCNGDPVDCSTGNFTETSTDLTVAGRAGGLSWDRSYNAQDTDAEPGPGGSVGAGWTSPYLMHLELDPDSGQVTVVQENAATVTFAPTADGGWEAPPWVLATLKQTSDGAWVFTRRDRSTFRFDASGRLASVADLNGETTRLGYDDSGFLTSVTDPSGQALQVAHDSQGRVNSVSDPLGRTVRYDYDAAGDLGQVTDPAGGVSRYGYGAGHLLVSMTDPAGAVTRNSYDELARVVSQTDPIGAVTTMSYDDSAVPAEVDDPELSATTVTDPTGLVSTQVFRDDQPVQETVGVGTASPRTWTFDSDPATLGVSIVSDPLGRATTSTYDARGNTLSVTAPSGASSTFSYDSLGDVLSATDPDGVTTAYEYDDRGNLLSSTQPTSAGTAVTRYGHDDPQHVGDVTSVTDPLGRVTRVSHNAAGLVASVTSSAGRVRRVGYDVVGRPVTTELPGGGINRTGYDVLDNPTVSIDAAGERTVRTFDPDGRLLSSTDPAGHVSRSEYDAAGQLVAQQQPDGTVLRYGYDSAGQLLAQTDAAGRVTHYGYDLLGDPTSTTLPTGAVTRDDYDLAGQLSSVSDPLGRVTRYGYTADGQPASVDYSDGHTPAVRYTYDPAGQRLTMTDGTGTSSYSYDAAGQLLSTTDGTGHGLSFSYDQAGEQISLTYPDGTRTSRRYDSDGQLAGLTDGHGGTFTFSYTPDGQLAATRAPNGVLTRRGYDVRDQLTALRISHGSHSLLSLDYGRTVTGLLASQRGTGAGSGGPRTYGYDSLDQLTSSLRGQAAASSQDLGGLRYKYDPAGLLLGVAGPGAHRSVLTYTSGGVLQSLTQRTGRRVQASVSFGYDLLGQRTSTTAHLSTPSKATPRSSHTGGAAVVTARYGYDQAGELTSYTGPNGGLPVGVETPTGQANARTGGLVHAGYTYDGDGVRTAKTVNGQRTSFVEDPTSALPELLSSTSNDHPADPRGCEPDKAGTEDGPGKNRGGQHDPDRHGRKGQGAAPAKSSRGGVAHCPAAGETVDYLYGPDGAPLAQTSTGGAAVYLHADHLGSTRLLTDGRGRVLARYSYTPYGSLERSDRQDGRAGASLTNLLFTGAWRDSETGLYHLAARYYDPNTAQFLTRDPMEALTGQAYTYAAGSPLNATDPTGLRPPREGSGATTPVVSPSRSRSASTGCNGGGTGKIAKFVAGEMVGQLADKHAELARGSGRAGVKTVGRVLGRFGGPALAVGLTIAEDSADSKLSTGRRVSRAAVAGGVTVGVGAVAVEGGAVIGGSALCVFGGCEAVAVVAVGVGVGYAADKTVGWLQDNVSSWF